jgi:hypothetical protein
MLPRVRRLLLPMLVVVLALASCGGGADPEDVGDLLDRTFSKEISSADLKAELELQLEGSPALDRPLRIQAAGPFRTNEGKLPSVDLELKVGIAGGGQTVTTGLLSTGDRAFLKFQDVYYEQPASKVRRANRFLARNRGRGAPLRWLGVNPRSWLSAAEAEGEEEVGGVETRHVSGTLDVEAVILDVNRFARRSASAIGGVSGHRPPDTLTRKDIDWIAEAVKKPSFDVYVGRDDDIVRRMSGRIEFEAPEDSPEHHGIDAGTLQFSVELADVNGDQEIQAPRKASPLSKLTRSLGGGWMLEGLGSGGDAPGNADPSEAPSDSEDDTGPEAESFREYADCLDEARPGDTRALQRCAELLKGP